MRCPWLCAQENVWQPARGRYATASEVMREGLRIVEEREQFCAAKLESLRAADQDGQNRRPAEPLRPVN